MVDILLINPREKKLPFERIPPLGLAWIASVLERGGFSVRVTDLEVEPGKLEDYLSKYQPRFLGISGMTHTRFESFKLAKLAKNFSKEIVTIYGGVHASFTGVDTLRNIKEIDFVIRGEGEETILELLQAYRKGKDALRKISGISYRLLGEIAENPSRHRILNLDSLPPPAWHLLPMEKYALNLDFLNKKGIAFITSRGCTMRCTFCSASAMYSHYATYHSADYVLNETERLIKYYNYQGIRFFDATLTLRCGHIESICKEIIKRNLSFPWECEIRVGTVDRELLLKMKEAGCYYVDFGIESASQKVLDLMRKGFTIEKGQELLDWCVETGLKTKVFFSFGHIGETMSDVEATFRFIDKNRPKISTLACGAGVRIYPGTYLEEYALKNGLLPSDFSWSQEYDERQLADLSQDPGVPLLFQPQLGYEELAAIRLRIIGERFRGWAGVKLGIRKITKLRNFKKLLSVVLLYIRRCLQI